MAADLVGPSWVRLGLAMIALGVACGAPQPVPGIRQLESTNPYVDRQTLLADPAAQLRMPGAEELQAVGAERRTTLEGYATAFDGGIFSTPRTPDQVYAFYDASLRQQGWQRDTYEVYLTSTDLIVWGWCKPERLFRVAILDPQSFTSSRTGGGISETVLHATINGRTPNVSCPSAR